MKTNLALFCLAATLCQTLAQSSYTPCTFTTLAGNVGYGIADGTGSAARFNNPYGVALDSAGNVYVAENGNGTIRKGFPTGSAPAPNLGAPSVSGGEFGFDMTGLAGLAVDLEGSGDLSHWQWAGTYILNGGTAHFVSPTPLQDAQFYRARVR